MGLTVDVDYSIALTRLEFNSAVIVAAANDALLDSVNDAVNAVALALVQGLRDLSAQASSALADAQALLDDAQDAVDDVRDEIEVARKNERARVAAAQAKIDSAYNSYASAAGKCNSYKWPVNVPFCADAGVKWLAYHTLIAVGGVSNGVVTFVLDVGSFGLGTFNFLDFTLFVFN